MHSNSCIQGSTDYALPVRSALSIWVALLLLLSPSFEANAATYFLSTIGNDSAAGTSSAVAWRSFPHALAQLKPGDVLLVEPGTWTSEDGGVLDATCPSLAQSGTPDGGIITVKSVLERQAHIVSNGALPAARINGCSHWSLEGLFLERNDFESPGNISATARISNSSSISVRRILTFRNNRTINGAAIQVDTSSDVRVEDCEMYDFSRVGLVIWEATGVVVRRCYANQRGRLSIDGGHEVYSIAFSENGTNTLFENNVSEGVERGYMYGFFDRSVNGRYLGLVSMFGTLGFLAQRVDAGAENNIIQDFVSFRPSDTGVFFLNARGDICDGCTVFESSHHGFLSQQQPGSTFDLTTHVNRMLVTGIEAPALRGFWIEDQRDFSLTDVNAYGFPVPYLLQSGGIVQGLGQGDPKLGNCPVMIPESSPMKRAASDGGDIGANLIYRYEDGVLTDKPLWSPGFPCGATVPGVNDIPDASCFDVHLRLGVNNCVFPEGYLPSEILDGGDSNDAGVDENVARKPWQLTLGCDGCSATSSSAVLMILLLWPIRSRVRRPSKFAQKPA